jgi:hypothetical protein
VFSTTHRWLVLVPPVPWPAVEALVLPRPSTYQPVPMLRISTSVLPPSPRPQA